MRKRQIPGTLTPIALWVAFAALEAACSSDSAPTGADDLLIEPIQIERVEVSVLETSPPTAVAHVEGILGDGCSELHSIRQERAGDVVTVTIMRQRPRDAVCTDIAKLFDQEIALEGHYPPGQYILKVNDTQTPFATE